MGLYWCMAHDEPLKSCNLKGRTALGGCQPAPAIVQFFTFAHLPEELQEVSRPFRHLAEVLVALTPDGAERTVALRKLLEAKDAAVRAKVAR